MSAVREEAGHGQEKGVRLVGRTGGPGEGRGLGAGGIRPERGRSPWVCRATFGTCSSSPRRPWPDSGRPSPSAALRPGPAAARGGRGDTAGAPARLWGSRRAEPGAPSGRRAGARGRRAGQVRGPEDALQAARRADPQTRERALWRSGARTDAGTRARGSSLLTDTPHSAGHGRPAPHMRLRRREPRAHHERRAGRAGRAGRRRPNPRARAARPAEARSLLAGRLAAPGDPRNYKSRRTWREGGAQDLAPRAAPRRCALWWLWSTRRRWSVQPVARRRRQTASASCLPGADGPRLPTPSPQLAEETAAAAGGGGRWRRQEGSAARRARQVRERDRCGATRRRLS